MNVLRLERPLLFIDLESTSADPLTAKIIEIGVSVLHPDGSINPNGWTKRLNPGIPIPPEATEIHHITDADVADCPPFLSIAPMLAARLVGKDLAGFNLRNYDLILLDTELRRCGFKLDLTGVHVIDAFNLYRKTDPRDLASYVEKYAGRKHEGAHGAGVDAQATLDALCGQLVVFQDLRDMPLAELAALSVMGDHAPADIAGKLYRDAEGILRFNFGKNEGRAVLDEGGYCDWMEKNDFPGSTMDMIDREFDLAREQGS
jgi:DNA polymerase-3 subunit epsilon